jgi:hypothetical protein
MTETRSVSQQVVSGLRIAGAWLLGMAWLGVVFAGLSEAFGTEEIFNEGHHPHRVVGYVLFVLAGMIMVTTAEHWKRAFPGIMLFAVFNSSREFTYGHAINNDSVLVSHWMAFFQLAVFTIVFVVSTTFKKHKLSVIDNAALLAFVGSIFWQAVDSRFATVKVLAGASCVVMAWVTDRYQHAQQRKRPNVHLNGLAQ